MLVITVIQIVWWRYIHRKMCITNNDYVDPDIYPYYVPVIGMIFCVCFELIVFLEKSRKNLVSTKPSKFRKLLNWIKNTDLKK